MSENTQNLDLPYIMPSQAQKHVTHNEAIRALDTVVQLAVIDKELATPPGSPSEGGRYIVATGATGDWSGHGGKIAAYVDGAWMIHAPKEGWLAWVADEDKLYVHDGSSGASAWIDNSGLTQAELLAQLDDGTVATLGVNANADATNRLSVNSGAVLFNRETDDVQVKLNKQAAADTASFLFQTNFSGRAEFGTIGNDDFAFKVSPDGSTFHTPFVIDKDDGSVDMALTWSLSGTLDVSAGTLTLADDQISGNKIHGGVISNFESTGIEDAATATVITLSSDGYLGVDEPTPLSLIEVGRGVAPTARDLSHSIALHRGSANSSNRYLGQFGWRSSDSGFPAPKMVAYISAEAEQTYSSDTTTATSMRFFTGSSGSAVAVERLTINHNGRVGIGETSPSTSLHVNGPARIGSYTVATVPSASSAGAGSMIYVSDETGGAVIAFSDGSNWRRLTDRAIVS